MARPLVLVTARVMPYLYQALEERFTLFNMWDESGTWRQHSQGIQAVVTNSSAGASASLIQALPRLEIVSSHSVGLDKVDLPACRQRGIAVVNTPDVLTDCTADLAVLLMLSTMRRICVADRFIRQGLWTSLGGFPLATKGKGGGQSLGVVSLIAKLLGLVPTSSCCPPCGSSALSTDSRAKGCGLCLVDFCLQPSSFALSTDSFSTGYGHCSVDSCLQHALFSIFFKGYCYVVIAVSDLLDR